jgi:hypothetical protein
LIRVRKVDPVANTTSTTSVGSSRSQSGGSAASYWLRSIQAL